MSYEARRQASREARQAVMQADAGKGAAIAFGILALVAGWRYGIGAGIAGLVIAFAVYGFARPPCPADIDKRLED